MHILTLFYIVYSRRFYILLQYVRGVWICVTVIEVVIADHAAAIAVEDHQIITLEYGFYSFYFGDAVNVLFLAFICQEF